MTRTRAVPRNRQRRERRDPVNALGPREESETDPAMGGGLGWWGLNRRESRVEKRSRTRTRNSDRKPTRVRASVAAVLTLAFTVTPAAQDHAHALECGQTITGSFGDVDEIAVHPISGAPGEPIRVRLVSTDSAPDAFVEAVLVYTDPETEDPRNAVAWGAGPGWRAWYLPDSASALHVHGRGAYELELIRLRPDSACAEHSLECGLPVASSLGGLGDLAIYPLSGEQDEPVRLRLQSTDDAPDAFVDASLVSIDPETGKLLTAVAWGAGPGWRAWNLPDSTNALHVRGRGTYELELIRLHPHGSCAEPGLKCGRPAVGSLVDSGDLAVHPVSGEPGEPIQIWLHSTDDDPEAFVAATLVYLDSETGNLRNAVAWGAGSGWQKWDLPSSASAVHVRGVGTYEVELIRLRPDRVCAGELLVVYDPAFPRHLSRIDENGQLFSSPEVYEIEGEFRDGVVTDGVTKLVLKFRTTSETPVSFSLPIGATDGSLLPVGGSSPTSSIVVSPVPASDGNQYAYAIYTAPDTRDAGLTGGLFSRQAEIQIADGAGPVRTEFLELHRPPVVLIHGIWDDASGWDWFHPRIEALGFRAFRAQYPNAASFDPRLPRELNLPVTSVARTILDVVLPEIRSTGIGATQVDVVAHSLGGLVARSYTQLPNHEYRRADNYNMGDLHNLLTIGTPHFGSRLANLAFATPCLLLPPNLVSLLPQSGGLGDTLSGAAADLREGSGALTALNQNPRFETPIHTIGTIASVIDEARLAIVLRLLFKQLSKTKECGIPLAIFEPLAIPSVLHGGANDLVVSLPSAHARRDASTAVSTVANVTHSSAVGWLSPFPNQRNSEEILALAADLLASGAKFDRDR